MSEKSIILNNGIKIPKIGLGTWPMDNEIAQVAVAKAIENGWRLIDTAQNYENEIGVGMGIKNSGINREEIFVTTKFNQQWHSQKGALEAAQESLKKLKLEYIDLFLIHWPNPKQDKYIEAFEGMKKLQEQGLVRAIGVSNFKPAHLLKLKANGFVPSVNQIQLDPYRQQIDTIEYNKANNIVTETWSPLDRAGPLLQEPIIAKIANEIGKTTSQIILCWHIQNNFIPLPKSSDGKRQIENLASLDFKLSELQMNLLNKLNNPNAEIIDSDIFGH
jgi:2,5-diketo-D-gluconate reductase A